MAFAVGRISEAGKIINPANNRKPYVACVVEMQRRFYGENKSYAQRIQVHSYTRDLQALAAELTQGTLVEVHGDVDAFASEFNHKTYANIRITGYVTVIAEDNCDEEPAPRSSHSVDSGILGNSPLPVRSAAVAHGDAPAPVPSDDDVPF